MHAHSLAKTAALAGMSQPLLKAELNTDTAPGRYVLTGSTRYSVLPQAAQSLTGRAHIINYSRRDH